MMNVLRKYWGERWRISPPVVFSVATLLLLLVTGGITLWMRDSALDINIHETYFVIPWTYISIPPAVYCGFWALFYWVMPILLKRTMVWWMSVLHSLLSFVVVIVIAAIWIELAVIWNKPRRYYVYDEFDGGGLEAVGPYEPDLLVVFFLALQLLAPANLLWTRLKRPRL